MAFIETLQILIIAIGAGFSIWGTINLISGYNNYSFTQRSYGVKLLAIGLIIVAAGEALGIPIR